MLIPDVKIYDIVNFFLNYVGKDYDDATNKTKTILYDLFAIDDNNAVIKLNKLQFLNEAVEIFYTRDVESPTKIQASIGYNLQRAQLPHIHIMLANKNKGKFDAIGLSQGEFGEYSDYQDQQNIYDKVRTFSASVILMCTGTTPIQVLTIQYFIEAMFDLLHEQIGLTGLLNHNFSTQDLQLYDQLAPKEIFSRIIMVNFDYQTQIKVRQSLTLAKIFQLTICDHFGSDYDYWESFKVLPDPIIE